MKKILFFLLLVMGMYQNAQAQRDMDVVMVWEALSEMKRNALRQHSIPPVTVLATTVKAKPAVWVTLLASGQSVKFGATLGEDRNGGVCEFNTFGIELYDINYRPMWTTGTYGEVAIMDAKSGAFVIHDMRKIVWSSSNTTSAGAFLQIDWTSHTLRIVDATGTKELWRSKK